MTALWSSGFRPFFLLGAAYGPLSLAGWMLGWAGIIGEGAGYPPLHLWHAHEMLLGFAVAFVCGFVLTALPSWAGTGEIKGGRLMLLVAVWSAGRLAAWSYSWVGPGAIAALDLALLPLLAILILPGLARAARKRYLAILLVLAALTAVNLAYHAAILRDDLPRAEQALLLTVNILIVLFSVVGGVLTPVFTETALRERGRSDTIGFLVPLEAAAIGSAILFAATAWPGVPATVSGAVGCLAATIHLVRFLRWRTLSIVVVPLVLAMHLGYAWLVAAMALRGLADLTEAVPQGAWIHAFSVGALGLMQLALLSRVTLRHTGRALALSWPALAGVALMLLSGFARTGASVTSANSELVAFAAVAWALPFVLFLATDAPKLWRPSLPHRIGVPSEP